MAASKRRKSQERIAAHEMYIKHNGQISNRAIAAALSVSEGLVRKWKCQDKWGKLPFNGNNGNTDPNAQSVTVTDNRELAKHLADTVCQNNDLTDKQKLFCMHYIHLFNARKAYMRAYNCEKSTAGVEGPKMLKRPEIQKEIEQLKKERMTKAFLADEDIVQKYIDIAFADITEFVDYGQRDETTITDTGPVKVHRNYVDLHDSAITDGGIVSEIREGKSGISIKLADRLKALEWLADHICMATEEQQARIAKLRAETKRAEEINTPQDNQIAIVLRGDVEHWGGGDAE